MADFCRNLLSEIHWHLFTLRRYLRRDFRRVLWRILFDWCWLYVPAGQADYSRVWAAPGHQHRSGHEEQRHVCPLRHVCQVIQKYF